MYKIHGRCILYKACAKVISVDKLPLEKKRTDDLVHFVLTWSYQLGIYNPNKMFLKQQQDIINHLLNYPAHGLIHSAITDVQEELRDILLCQQFHNTRAGRHILKLNRLRKSKLQINNDDGYGSLLSDGTHPDFIENGQEYDGDTYDEDMEELTIDNATAGIDQTSDEDDELDNFEELLQQHKWSKKIINPLDGQMTVIDAILLIAMVIPNEDRKHSFIASLQRDYIEKAVSNTPDNNADYVYHPALTLELINSHLQNAVDGGASIFTITNQTAHNVSHNNFSTWLLVSGETDANFQDAVDLSNYRSPTVQTFLNYPGYLDCHPRKGKFPTTQCQKKGVMPIHNLMLISLASSLVYTHLGPQRKKIRQFSGQFIPYPLNWLTDLPDTSILTMNANKSGPQSLFDFASNIGRDGTLLLTTSKMWGIHYNNQYANPQITTTRLQAIHTFDTSSEFPPLIISNCPINILKSMKNWNNAVLCTAKLCKLLAPTNHDVVDFAKVLSIATESPIMIIINIMIAITERWLVCPLNGIHTRMVHWILMC